jgi:hypothetical protein
MRGIHGKILYAMKMSEESIKMAVFWDVVPRILVKID